MKEDGGGFLNHGFLKGIAVTSFCFLSVVLIPWVGAFILLLTPLPVLFYYIKFGRPAGLALVAISLALVLLILAIINPDIVFPLLLFLITGGTGILIAEAFRKPWTVERATYIPVAALLFCGVLFLLLLSQQAGQPPERLIESYLLSSIAENIRIYEEAGLSPEQVSLIKDQSGPIAALLTRIFPALFTVGAGLFVGLNILAARRLLRRVGLRHPDFGDLSQWKAPERMVWLLIGAGGMLLVDIGIVRYTGLNLLIVCLAVYLCAGLSVISFFFRVKRIPVFFKVLFYMLILIQQYLLFLVMALGLFDLWADFRKRIKPVQDTKA